MLANDIIVHRDLFGDWEITTAGNYFATQMRLDQFTYLSAQDYPTFEDCKAYCRKHLDVSALCYDIILI